MVIKEASSIKLGANLSKRTWTALLAVLLRRLENSSEINEDVIQAYFISARPCSVHWYRACYLCWDLALDTSGMCDYLLTFDGTKRCGMLVEPIPSPFSGVASGFNTNPFSYILY